MYINKIFEICSNNTPYHTEKKFEIYFDHQTRKTIYIKILKIIDYSLVNNKSDNDIKKTTPILLLRAAGSPA